MLKPIISAICMAICYGTVHAKEHTFHGSADLSAGVMIDETRFVAANDEENSLRIYDLANPAKIPSPVDLTQFLDTSKKNPEADIEAAAMAGGRAFWISSHGRNKNGKYRKNRYRFFATKIEGEQIIGSGIVYKSLLEDLLKDQRYAALGLQYAAQVDQELDVENLAPELHGINIEALDVTADGHTLLIGFRNPRPGNKALVAPLINAHGVIDSGQPARFGVPILWDFGGLGIRSMLYSPRHKSHFIIAGAHDDSDTFRLYKWSGVPAEAPTLLRELNDLPENFRPEEILIQPRTETLFLASDDGSIVVEIASPAECMEGEAIDDTHCENKYLVEHARRTFRIVELPLD